MSKVKYRIRLKDKNREETFINPFYIESNIDYINVLEQLIEILKTYHLEITSSELEAFIIGSKNPKEEYVILERVDNARRSY